jgi:rsbT co-antagonist protein RsbR
MVAVALQYLRGNHLRSLILICWLVTVTIVLVGELLPARSQLPLWLLQVLRISSLAATIALVLLLLWQFASRLAETIHETQAANTALQAARAQLETQVAERTAALQAALAEVQAQAAKQARLLDENEQQRHTIREMSVPVLPLAASTLVMPLVGALDSVRLRLVQEQALRSLEQARARHLILEITGLLVVDAQVAQGLIQVVRAARLLGAEVIVVGIRPEVAQTLVGLGIQLSSVITRSTLQNGIDYALRQS